MPDIGYMPYSAVFRLSTDPNVLQITGNYSVTPGIFRIDTRGYAKVIVKHLKVLIQGAGLASEKYGSITALTNGIQVHLCENGNSIYQFLDGLAIRTTMGLQGAATDMRLYDFTGMNDAFAIDIDFDKLGYEIILNQEKNRTLDLRVSDNFTGLVTHLWFATGRSIDRKYESVP